MKKKGEMPKTRVTGLYFLIVVIIMYVIGFIFDSNGIISSLQITGTLFNEIIPVFIFVIVFMALVFYIITPKSIKKYVGKGSGAKGWVLAVVTGILSQGPVYVWFPMLKDMRSHGMKNGLISVFLSNRSIKLPFLPMMVFYFGGAFVAVLCLFMILASVIQGMIFDLLEGRGMTMDNDNN